MWWCVRKKIVYKTPPSADKLGTDAKEGTCEINEKSKKCQSQSPPTLGEVPPPLTMCPGMVGSQKPFAGL